MAQKRMFSQSVVGTDKFREMKGTAQALYLQLGMEGDDDGFVKNPKSIINSCTSTKKDLQTLIDGGYIYQFPSGVVLVLDWLVNNTLKNDRYKETVYYLEMSCVKVCRNKKYIVDESRVTEVFRNHNTTEHNATEPNEAEPYQEEQRKTEMSVAKRSGVASDYNDPYVFERILGNLPVGFN